jgi:dipeptidyl aminopeptidase/acylaminoacyl peptidase
VNESHPDRLRALYAYDLDRRERTLLFQPDGFDVGGAITDPYSRTVVGAFWTDVMLPRQTFFDAELESVRKAVIAKFGDEAALLQSWSKDRKRFLVYAAMNEGSYHLYDRDDDRVTAIASEYPDIKQVHPVTSAKAPTRDKARVPIFITAPLGKEMKKLPAVVLVHGGPSARDDASFDWWSQFLASRGYAVLQVNFRGSDGYGEAWENAGYGQWGGTMQHDVEDAVMVLGRAGLIDTDRLCIAGASYGGFAALAGAFHTPDLYRCAISVAGVADLPAMLAYEVGRAGSKSFLADYWQSVIGDRKDDKDAIRAASPLQNAEAIKAPVLLLHGEDDSIVPIAQSRAMAKRLKELGKTVSLIELKGDDHWLSATPTRTRTLEEIETFLAANLPTD